MRSTLAGLGLLLALAACEGGGDPVEQALRDASAANHAATIREGTVSRPVPAAAPGETADEAFVASMIAHHRSAVAMADVALARSRDPEVRRMAQVVRETRTREIAELRAWTSTAQTAP